MSIDHKNPVDQNIEKRPHLLVLMTISCVMAFAIVLVTPALPALALYFSKSKNSIKQIVTWFLLGFPLGVIFYAPFSNSFGRKNTLYFGFLIALIGTALCIFTYFHKSFLVMNIGRFLQGFGSIVGIQVAITIVGDCFKDQKARVVSALIMISVGVSPGIGIAIGAFLMNIGWVYCFYFYGIYYIFLLLVTKFFVHETLVEKKSLRIHQVVSDYSENLKVPQLLFCGFLLGTLVSVTYIFPSISAFIVLKRLSYPQNIFAIWNFIPPIGIIIGNLMSWWFVKWFSSLVQLYFGVVCLTLATLGYLIFFTLKIITIETVFFPYLVTMIALGFVNSNAVAYTVKFSKNKSNGSSVFSFFAYTSSFVFMLFLSFIKSTSIFVMPTFFLIISLLCWLFVIVLTVLKKRSGV